MRDDQAQFPGEMLDTTIIELLRRIPERWTEFDHDALTVIEARALYLLVAAGMVERKLRFRLRLRNHSVGVEGTITATGEYGLAEAMDPVLATMWPLWKDVYTELKAGETSGAPVSINERLTPDEWRLTDQGVLARHDLETDERHTVLNFVLRRGPFDGKPRVVRAPGRQLRIAQRLPVRGTGALIKMRKVQVDDESPIAVNVRNWGEGAAAIAGALREKDEHSGQAGAQGAGQAAVEPTGAPGVAGGNASPPVAGETCNGGSAHGEDPPQPGGVRNNSLRRAGDYWRLTFVAAAGEVEGSFLLRDRVGLQLIWSLLYVPDSLAIQFPGKTAAEEPATDRMTLGQARDRIARLEEAKLHADPEQFAEIEDQIEKLREYIRVSTRPGGEIRTLKSPRSLCLNRFRNAVNSALRHVEQHAPKWVDHMRRSIDFAAKPHPVYRPPTPTEWK